MRYKGYQQIISDCMYCPNMTPKYDEKAKIRGYKCYGKIPSQELIANDDDSNSCKYIDIPDWCPLEDVDI